MALAEIVTTCRACGKDSLLPFLSLGMTPVANNLVSPAAKDDLEPMYPLGLAFCTNCTLVQLFYELPASAIFTADYPYYSSYSDTVTNHARCHAHALTTSLGLDRDRLVVEVASNDGYLLSAFAQRGVPVLGIEPAPGPAAVAQSQGVPTLVEFFGRDLASKLRSEGVEADVLIANNVMAHVPDLNDFVAGLATLLADDGVLTIENPYVRDLVQLNQFDTVYHEHYCYFSCTAVDHLLRRHGLYLRRIEHFEHLHGGTLRWTVSKRDEPEESVAQYLEEERCAGMTRPEFYSYFGMHVIALQKELLDLLYELALEGATLAAYGAAAKGVTLLNSTRVPASVISYVVDRNVHKQDRFLPGIHVPIRGPEVLETDPPDYLLLLAWNHAEEIMAQLESYRRAGGRFILPIPKPQIVG